MRDCGFSETDVREMLETPLQIVPDHYPGRWVVTARWQRGLSGGHRRATGVRAHGLRDHSVPGERMKRSYLEVTYRHGKPLAAYLYLPRRPGDVSARTEKRAGGLLVDYAADGRPIGIELTSPANVSLAAINDVVASVDEDRKSTRLNSSHRALSRMPSSA